MVSSMSAMTARATPAGASVPEAPASATPSYRRPRLAYVGSVTRLVQSGPVGNRYETYRCSYWSDR
jgi:hypothetical protein